jgi:hypothetical protein
MMVYRISQVSSTGSLDLHGQCYTLVIERLRGVYTMQVPAFQPSQFLFPSRIALLFFGISDGSAVIWRQLDLRCNYNT